MTVQDIFNEAYEDTNTSTANYTYAKALKKFNSLYKSVWRMIVTTQEDYFWTYWNTNLQAWAREYKVERQETDLVDEFWNVVLDDDENPIKVPWIAKVKRVKIWEDFVDATILPQLASLEEEVWYRGWMLKDNHIILNRTPEEDLEWGLRIEGIQAVNDLALTSTEDDIFPWHADLLDFLEVLVRGLKTELWEHKQDFEKADRCKAHYNERLEDMKRYITQRVQDIYYSDVQK